MRVPASCTVSYEYECLGCYRREVVKMAVQRGMEVPLLFPKGWRSLNGSAFCPDHTLLVKIRDRAGVETGEFLPLPCP